MKGWYSNRQQHGLASKGIRTKYQVKNKNINNYNYVEVNGIYIFDIDDVGDDYLIFNKDETLDIFYKLKEKYPNLVIIIDDEKWYEGDGFNIHIYDNIVNDNDLTHGINYDMYKNYVKIALYSGKELSISEIVAYPKKGGLAGKIIRAFKDYVDNPETIPDSIGINDNQNESFWSYMGFEEDEYGRTIYKSRAGLK